MKKRNVYAGAKPKTGAGKNRTHRPNSSRRPNTQISSAHKLQMARRRARVTELASEGKSVRAAEDILRSEGFTHCDHVTVAADLKLECERLSEAAKATTEKHRQRVYAKLMLLEDRVRARGWDDPNYQSDLLSIIDRVIKLLGLNADTRVSVVAVNNDGIPTERLIGWRRWLKETQFISEEDYDAIWAVCRKLSKPPTAETTAALMIPPADSPLWREDDDEKGEPN